ncbi:MAG: fructose PTS transporter subunit IIA, partial [Lactobacillus sp.]|nr:fructose PTS transporter subunit IIA [Lactobacillus sp.]
MKLSQGTSTKLILLDKKVACKDEAFRLLASKFFDEGVISSTKEFIKAVYAREKESPTGIENGIAIPHGKSSTVKKAQFAILRTLDPIEDYKSLQENNKVKLIFMMAIPENGSEEHLDVLSTLATKLINQQYRKKIMMAKT